jgi:shikimate kinase
MKDELLEEYVAQIEPVLDLAKRAYGSRNTKSPQHDASRKYTGLLVEFYERGGSLLQISKALGVTYAGVRRRVTTNDVPANESRSRSKATPEEVKKAAQRVKSARSVSVIAYHEALRHEYEDNKISLNKLAKALGLSSSNPLYYGVARTKITNK